MTNTRSIKATNNINAKCLLTKKDVSKLLCMSTRRVQELPITKIVLGHRSVRYRETDVLDFIAKRTVKAIEGGKSSC